MKLSLYIQDLLRRQSGQELRLPSDIERLTLDIESQTGQHIGVNTMKRLLGFIDDERTPRTSTLDILAHYLGYADWDVLSAIDSKSNSSFETPTDEIRTQELPIGQRIQVNYLPDRQLIIEHLGEGHFIVRHSENSKLHTDDEITLTHLVSGYPLLISHVVRDGNDLGSFTAGKTQGITFKHCL